MKYFGILISICGVAFRNSVASAPYESTTPSAGSGHDGNKCGVSNGKINTPSCSISSQSIIGGSDARKGTWPWQVSLMKYDDRWCGASLIHPEYVLTAAHCTDKINPQKLYIYGGITSLYEIYSSDNPPWGSTVERVIQHEFYNSFLLNDDVSLIKLANPAPLSANLNTVCLPDESDSISPGEGCYVTGWGTTYNNTKDRMRNLQELCIPIIGGLKECSKYTKYMNDKKICTGYKEGGAQTCYGDSGGPLVCKRGEVYKLFGIVSGGGDKNGICATPDTPDYLMNVQSYLPWIRQHIPYLIQ